MSPTSPIALSPLPDSEPAKITQLYRYLELYSAGEPPVHSLFVYAPAAGPLPIGDAPSGDTDQLLIIDPPADLATRFKIGSQTAALFTGPPQPTTVPLVHTVPGGVAHIRMGDHFLDVYSHAGGAVIHLPPLGIICSGGFGSDVTVPVLAPDSDGSGELDTLRLLARLLKQHKLALLIPHAGTWLEDKLAVMERFAADVAYFHGLRRVVVPLAQRGEAMDVISEMAASILPASRRTHLGRAAHAANIAALVQSMRAAPPSQT